MRNLIPIALVSMLLACGGGDPAPADAPEPAAAAADASDAGTRAATIAKEVRAAPGDVDAILKKHGLNTEEFEALLYEVAASSELSAKYLAALDS
ncbi:MAG: hypothetical protein EP330_24635 [Deltaproteobacteria bacterium]|nr:MAG: hypothetical protein EP330_24635 [Deltaproteobacteria bacterium]